MYQLITFDIQFFIRVLTQCYERYTYNQSLLSYTIVEQLVKTQCIHYSGSFTEASLLPEK